MAGNFTSLILVTSGGGSAAAPSGTPIKEAPPKAAVFERNLRRLYSPSIPLMSPPPLLGPFTAEHVLRTDARARGAPLRSVAGIVRQGFFKCSFGMLLKHRATVRVAHSSESSPSES